MIKIGAVFLKSATNLVVFACQRNLNLTYICQHNTSGRGPPELSSLDRATLNTSSKPHLNNLVCTACCREFMHSLPFNKQ